LLVTFSRPQPGHDRRHSRDIGLRCPRDLAETDSLAEEDGFGPSVPRQCRSSSDLVARPSAKIRMVRRPGEDSDYDTYIYRWFAERLAAALAVSKKMAENAGVDLSDAL